MRPTVSIVFLERVALQRGSTGVLHAISNVLNGARRNGGSTIKAHGGENIATEFLIKNINAVRRSRGDDAQFAERRMAKVRGGHVFRLITTTGHSAFAGYSVICATLILEELVTVFRC